MKHLPQSNEVISAANFLADVSSRRNSSPSSTWGWAFFVLQTQHPTGLFPTVSPVPENAGRHGSNEGKSEAGPFVGHHDSGALTRPRLTQELTSTVNLVYWIQKRPVSFLVPVNSLVRAT